MPPRDLVLTRSPLALSPDVVLADWQANAVRGWRDSRHPTRGARHGILEAVTGTGKTLAAIACMVDAAAEVPALRIAVVVPGQELARQWATELKARLGLTDRDVGLRMTGRSASLHTHRVVVWVINSARKSLAADCKGLDVMLVVDECHRSGSGENRRIYDAPTRFRIGLSATAQRQGEVDDDGLLLPLDQQIHARQLGPTIPPRLTVALAEEMGILPPFRLIHHGLSLSPAEQLRYRTLSQEVSAAIQEADHLGLKGGAVYAAIAAGPGGRFNAAQVAAAQEVQRATLARKHFLYLRPERARVAALLVAEALSERPLGAQALLFHERIAPTQRDVAPRTDEGTDDTINEATGDESAEARVIADEGADQLYARLCELAEQGRLRLAVSPDVALRRNHSGHPDPDAIPAMRRSMGDPKRAQVLVSVKGAVEGVDLPSADLGVVVASSSSVRQRIQTLGRILRPLRGPDGRPLPPSAYAGLPPRTLHLLYIHGTVDDEIYQQTDWEELLGNDRNGFRRWEFGAEVSSPDAEPPEPPPSDAEAAGYALDEWEKSDGVPVPWIGRQPSQDAQPLIYAGNCIRSRRDAPPLAGWEGVAAIVDRAARELDIPSVELRGALYLRIPDGLVIRAVPRVLGELLPVNRAGDGRPVRVRWLVLGRFHGQLGQRQIGGR